MRIKKIELESLYTPYTLDMYQTFTMEDADDQILESLNEGRDELLEYDDVDFTYDMEGYGKALAENLVGLLNEKILDDVIIKVESDCKVISPREYNFVTDKIILNISVDMEKLTEYIEANRAKYDKDKLQDTDGFWWFGDEQMTMLSYYLMRESVKKYSKDDYFYDQIETVSAYDYVEYEVPKDTYYFNVRATDKHDSESAIINAKSLREAKEQFADQFPDDIDNIELIATGDDMNTNLI